MNLGVQYYRAPFPEEKYWAEDLARIRDAGLNTVQLWVLWAWVEPKPGEFRFDDYDCLVDLAGKNGLGVVLSTIAEIHPYWIHHEVLGSEMLDHLGRKVISSSRGECHFGVTPGGCFDHPGVWERMARFLTEVVTRYRSAAHLRGWDAWNELRWNVQADGLVCFCEHTLRAFREWLGEKYGSLDAVNTAWKRRYRSFEEILPGKLPDRPYTEMMAFEHFITWRANQHGRNRYRVMKALDPQRPVTVHGAAPCTLSAGGANDHALNRGNDWFYADDLDGIGCSSFPKWGNMDDADFALRVDCVRSAARGKRVWLSEVQGGAHSIGFDFGVPVDAPAQQRWIWNGLASGAETILFWCWRDEVFGRESSGFGLAGSDGRAEERIQAMRVTGRLLEAHRDLLAHYRPAPAEVGLFFSPQTYYLHWAQEGNAQRAVRALTGYGKALARRSIPFEVVEETHLDHLGRLKVLFLPRTLAVDDGTAEKLAEFVKGGGTLVCESETGAFDSIGLYRYPEDRFTARLAGGREVGRRRLTAETIQATLDGTALTLGVTQWFTPWILDRGTAWAECPDGAVIAEVPVGKGRLILCGAYLGEVYRQTWNADFERFVESVVRRAGWRPEVEVVSPPPEQEAYVYLKHGFSAKRPVVFVFFPENCGEARLRLRAKFFPQDRARDLISGREIRVASADNGQECSVPVTDWRLAVVVG